MRRVVAAMFGVVLLVAGCGAAGGSPGAATATPPVPAEATTVPPAASSPAPTTSSPEPVTPATAMPATTTPTTTPAEATPTTAVTAETVPEPVVRSGADRSLDQPVGDPVSISIPAIGVDSELVSTEVLPDGTVDVPVDANIAGWYTGGPRPGERGPAVIMGHVDNRVTGPGVFYRLVELPVGAPVTVDTTDGPQHFVVQSVQRFSKAQFPTDLVYGAEPGATLRLITCGGSFDRSIRHYRDNIVAFLVKAED
jgi:hypothetical protein